MNLEKFRNKLLVFESEDHTGKSTIAKLLNEHLNKNDIKSIFTFQPGDQQFGKHAIILDEFCTGKKYQLDPLSNFFAFLLDRSEQTSKIVIPHLEKGYTVISDRWWYSTITYQFYGKQLLKKYNLNITFASWMNKLASHFVDPDCVFYFERPQNKIDNTKNDDRDLFESESYKFKKRVKDAYLDLVRSNRLFKVIKVSDDFNITLNRVLNTVI